MQFICFNTTKAQSYTFNQRVARVDNCNGWVARNMGDDPVRVNGHLLYPGTVGTSAGESYTEGGNLGEIFMGYLEIQFEGTGADPRVDIAQKFYILDDIKSSQNTVR